MTQQKTKTKHTLLSSFPVERFPGKKYYCRENNTCSCRKYPSTVHSWRYYGTMDKFVTKTDNIMNHTAVKITTADTMKLSSETFVQGFSKTCSWMTDTKRFLVYH